jgi:hypothetical protein
MESIQNYKASIEISHDKSYSIQQQNIFFDTFAGKEQINTAQGKMTDEAFAELTSLLAHTPIFKMKNVYGFEKKEGNPFDDMLYQLKYTEGNKSKTILIRPNPANSYSGQFPKLLSFMSNYISGHISKR